MTERFRYKEINRFMATTGGSSHRISCTVIGRAGPLGIDVKIDSTLEEDNY